ncbi:chemotaxis protein CheA, partial [Corallococcus sp. CA047B]|uniref:chemotaxis protein CheA n=1 Tax=Corallococcus sp. CA047B TaxID=2316729 RepID=UPI0018F6AC7E
AGGARAEGEGTSDAAGTSGGAAGASGGTASGSGGTASALGSGGTPAGSSVSGSAASGSTGSGGTASGSGPSDGASASGSGSGGAAGTSGSGPSAGASGTADASGLVASGAPGSAAGTSGSGTSGSASGTPGPDSGAGRDGPGASGAAGSTALAVLPPASLMPPRELSSPDALYGAPTGQSLVRVPAEVDPGSPVAALAAGLKAVTNVGVDGRAAAPRWSVRLRISPTCQVPGVRAFLVHKRLSTLGTLVDLRPPLEELKAGRIPDGFIQVDLETAVGEAGIQTALRNVAEVEVVSVSQAVPEPPIIAVPPPTSDSARATADASSRTVRVRTELLDYFLDTVGELMLATARLREVGKELPENTRPALEEGVYRLHTLVKDLHDKVMSARMTPLSLITDRLPRAARDLARRKEREVELVITGAEIELDRAILDELADPLLHLLRNCIDHGLEAPEERLAAKKSVRGRVLVTVRRARDRVIIDIEDDGRGMDPVRLKASALKRGLITEEAAARMADRDAFLLSCLPGVSTAKELTDISGRGVGMDAVKRVVESVGGTLEIDSERGRGTVFTLRLPLTVAVVHLLLVQVGEEVFGLPIAKVVGATEADPETLSRSRETALLPHGNGLLPVHPLEVLLGVPASPRPGFRPFVVMEGDAGTGKVALAVDRLLGQEEVVLKPLSRPLDLLPGLSGVTILGNGRPVFILDVPRLLTA